MARDGYKWIDCDMHLAEPGDLWANYIDPKFKDNYHQWVRVDASFNSLLQVQRAGPRPIERTEAEERAHPTAKLKAKRYQELRPYANAAGTCVEPDGQLRAMDTEGIDIAVLFPSVGSNGWRVAPPDAAMAIAQAYNDWLHAFCQYDPARLKVNALVPIVGDVDAAVREIRRVVNELGAVSIQPGSTRPDCRLDDPVYEPVWAEAERLNVPLTFHGTAQLHLAQRYARDPLHGHASGRGIEHPVAFMELLYGGVLERHPALRVAFLEAGASWIMYWLFRLEEEFEKSVEFTPELAERVRLRPIDYWRRQCFTSVEVEEWPLRWVIEMVGDDTLMVSSDFPHHDCAFPEAFSKFMAIPGVSDASKRKILWDNTARLYNLD
jgi:predicted TIM-barrel fold metal-dependent hydrolase